MKSWRRACLIIYSLFLGGSLHGAPNAGEPIYQSQALRAKACPSEGKASWYGESHRGKLMADGKKFDPDQLTAASWFYPLGTKVRVTLDSETKPRSVTVTITDRGPAARFVERGRVIDLSHAAFRLLDNPDKGLIRIKLEALN